MKLLPSCFRALFITMFLLFFICYHSSAAGRKSGPEFSVIAFITGKNDAGHVSYVHEANRWFSEMAEKFRFNEWSSLFGNLV